MGKKNDKELQEDLKIIYFESKSLTDFNNALKEYIKENKITKTKEYLKRLLDEYKKDVSKTTLEYEMICNTQEIHRIESSYRTMVKKIIPMSDEELINFIKENDINRIRIKFYNFIKYSKTENEIEIAKQVLERINKIYDFIKDAKSSKYEQQKYDIAIEVFDTMVNKGFFNYGDFKTKMNKHFGLDALEMERLVTNSRVLLRTKYPKKMEEYNKKIEENKIKFYILYHQQIKHMIFGIKNGTYDIVDYYINFDLSPVAFENLYYSLTDKKIIKPEDKIAFNKFFKKYNEKVREEARNIVHGKPFEYNGIITLEDEEIIKEFMEKNGIPEKYFKLCYKKYKEGSLKRYYGRQLTRNIPTK